MSVQLDPKKIAQESLAQTAEIIDKFGPRLASSESCMQAADYIKNELSKSCDHTGEQLFKFGKGAFLSFGNIQVFLYFLAIGFIWITCHPLALLSLLLSQLVLILEYIFYFKVYDKFFPQVDGKNVYGVIDPKEKATKTIIFSGHHDSAHIFNFYVDHPEWYLVRETKFLISQWAFTLYEIVYAIGTLYQGGSYFSAFDYNYYTIIINLIFTFGIKYQLPILGYTHPKGTPGAGDNLVSVTTGLQIAKFFHERAQSGKGLNHTRLMFVSFDAEEEGLRGSRAFYQQRLDQWKEMPTYNFNIDCPYFSDTIQFLTSDINQTQPLSKDMAHYFAEKVREYGLPATETPIRFLAGATDSAEAARAGVNSTCYLGIPFTNAGRDIVYHSPRDTPDKIDPRGLEIMAKIFVDFVYDVEAGKYPEENMSP